jgi:intein/homing endonuclease
MKGTLFSADFVKDNNGNLRLLELNTDTSIITAEVKNLNWQDFINVLESNSITKVDIIYKPAIHQDIIDNLVGTINNSSLSLSELNLYPENITTIYPTFVTDESDRFILRICYDESAIFDSVYCKNRLETFKLFTDSNNGEFVSPFYYSSSLFEINTLEYNLNPSNIPDAVIKDIDEEHNPISFYKIGSHSEEQTNQERWEMFILENKSDDKLIEQYNYIETSLVNGKVTSIRNFSIVYGSELQTINLLSYKIPSIFSLPETLESEVTDSYTNYLPPHHYYEFTTNYIKTDSAGMLSTHKILMEDDTYKTLNDAQVGDVIKSYYISGSPQLEGDIEIMNWSFDGSSFTEESYLTSSIVVFKDVEKLKYGAMVEYVVDGDSIFSGMSKRYLVFDSGSNLTQFKHAAEINPSTDYFYDSGTNLIDIDESNFYVTTDTELNMIVLDVEDTDTYIISGSTDFHSLITHNAPCFVAGTNISMFGGGYKNVEHINVNDTVLSFNFKNGKVEPQKVKGIGSKEVKETVIYTFKNDTTLRCTLDHPLYSKEQGWISKSPDYTLSKYGLTTKESEVGFKIQKQDGSEVEITAIEIVDTPIIVHNVNVVEQNHNFFANEFLVHNRRCFVGGTKIKMADNTTKNIEDIEVGDMVLSLNEETLELESKMVFDIDTPIHADLVTYELEDGTKITSTTDHPYYTHDLELVSFNPDLTNEEYDLHKEVFEIKVGDVLRKGEYGSEIVDIKLRDEERQTFIISVEDNHNFFANGILVHNK